MNKPRVKSPYTPQQTPSSQISNRQIRSTTSNPYDASGCSKSAPPNEESELVSLLSALGVTDAWCVENIKETSMNRFNVKKTKRKHIKRILDDAFEQLKEYDR